MSAFEKAFHTPLDVDQCRERLLHSLRERSTWVGGAVQENRFYYRERFLIGLWPYFVPELHGFLIPRNYGTDIQVRFEKDRAVYKFIGAMSILFLLIGVWIVFTDLIGSSTLLQDNIEYIPRDAAILIFAILGNLVVAHMLTTSSKKKLLDHVRQLLIAVEQT